MKKKIIFINLPRTGGVTLEPVLKKQYKDKVYFIDSTKGPITDISQIHPDKIPTLLCISGHFPFGFHKYLTDETRYITMLRDPVDRIISHYYSVIGRPWHYLHDKVVKNNLSIADYVTSGITIETSNSQTQLLSGCERPLPLNIDDPIAKEAIETAKRNLSNYFEVVGIFEKYEESVILFKRKLGWKNVFYYKQNVSQNSLVKDKISDETINIIKKYNLLDIELYFFAKKLFENMLMNKEKSFMKDLKILKIKNSIYSSIILNYKFTRKTLKKIIYQRIV
ncbi:MAG: sulfotransferase family 2 domain-containing protein [Bacteroidetes bacterium]|nr:sulfotransferase family 2 domain-containing protein [Bacteroidota bacterium]